MTPPAVLPVPLAMVLACASPTMSKLVTDRAARGEAPCDPALVSLHGDRYFAQVAFVAPARCALIIALDVWARPCAAGPQNGLASLRGVVLPEIPASPSVTP